MYNEPGQSTVDGGVDETGGDVITLTEMTDSPDTHHKGRDQDKKTVTTSTAR